MDVSGRFEKGARSFYPSAPPQTAAKSSSFCDVSSGDCVLSHLQVCANGWPGHCLQALQFFQGNLGQRLGGIVLLSNVVQRPSNAQYHPQHFCAQRTAHPFWLPCPDHLALLLNEMRCERYKKALQTVLYIPHFFSWVIVGGIVSTVFSQETGIINAIIKHFTGEPYPFLYREGSWIAIFIGAGVWKGMGFGTIVYLAALTAIDPSYYEAAVIDGANKRQQICHITLPCIKSTIITLFILQTGSVMEVGV